MTEAELKKAIAERTKIPFSIVCYIVDTEHAILMEALASGEEVKTPSVKLHSGRSKRQVLDPKTGLRKALSRVMIYVRPRRMFRDFLNKAP